MAKSVLFSFHYDRDAWRVQQIINMGTLEGQTILNAQKWEEVKRQGDAAVKKWIADQMAYKSAVVPSWKENRKPALGQARDCLRLGQPQAACRYPHPWSCRSER